MEQLTISEARAQLPHLLDQVELGAEVVITRHGRPVGVLVSPDRLGQAQLIDGDVAKAAAWLRQLLAAPDGSAEPGIAAERAEALIREVRRNRASG